MGDKSTVLHGPSCSCCTDGDGDGPIISKVFRDPSGRIQFGLNPKYRIVHEESDLDLMQCHYHPSKMRERKDAIEARKQSKNVKKVIVTQGKLEEYNIDEVLIKLGENKPGENKPKDKERKKRKKKSKREEQNREGGENVTDLLEDLNIDSASTIDPILDEKEKLNELVPTLSPLDEECQNTEPEQIESKITNDIATDAITNDNPTEAITNNNPTEAIVDDIATEAITNEPTEAITDDNPTEPECSICFNPRVKTFLFYPCGHATFCKACADRIVAELKKCPTCQSPICGSCPVFH